jgi:hypothetical protein
MKKNVILIFILIGFLLPSCKNGDKSFPNAYYVNGETGNDANSGTSPAKAWKTLAMINKMQINAGEKVLLRSGQTFTGNIIIKSIVGTPEAPVIFSSYGNGRATIESGDSSAFIALECENLIFKKINTKGSGRLMGNKTSGIEFFKVRNGSIDSVETSGYLFSGIQVSGGKDIRITNVRSSENGSCGINVSTASGKGNDADIQLTKPRNIYVGYCIAENNPGCPAIKNNHSGNGILLGGVTNGVIEYCEAMNNGWDMPREGNGPVGIWGYMCDSLIIQRCYSHHNKTSLYGKDGGGFDFDGGITNSILQYNISAYNEGTGYGIFQYKGAAEWKNNIMRYNISYNDGCKNSKAGILVWSDPEALPMEKFHAYNNTIVNNQGLGLNFEPGAYKDFIFENNIFLITTATDMFVDGKFTLVSFKRNLYWSGGNAGKGLMQPKILSDKEGLVADPQLEMPQLEYVLNFDMIDFQSFPYFKLKEGSVCSGNGNLIPVNGGIDFWGRIVSSDSKPNLGADGE